MSDSPLRLLSGDHPAPVSVLRPEGTSPFALACEEGGRLALPAEKHRPLRLDRNEPYALSDATEFTTPARGEKRGIVHVQPAIRQDSIETAETQSARAERLAIWFFRCPASPSIMAWA